MKRSDWLRNKPTEITTGLTKKNYDLDRRPMIFGGLTVDSVVSIRTLRNMTGAEWAAWLGTGLFI